MSANTAKAILGPQSSLYQTCDIVNRIKLDTKEFRHLQIKKPLPKTHFIQKSDKTYETHCQKRNALCPEIALNSAQRVNSSCQKAESRGHFHRLILKKMKVRDCGKQEF